MTGNKELKMYAKAKKVELYLVAECFGVTDATFSRWLRKEFSPKKQEIFKAYVDEIALEKAAEEQEGA